LDDEVGADQWHRRVVEQTMKDGGGGAERNAAHRAERARGKRDVKEVCVDHAHVAQLGAQSVGPNGVELYGHHLGIADREREREGAGARADVDDELARKDSGVTDYAVSNLGAKKILPEASTSYVSGCPPVGGHGPSSLKRPCATV
jgi:hypothetical protein